ncbi:Zn(2)-C6 fungal-type domain-containing protein [Favolaschia claudopus]|uniref:Oxidation resistance protein 1 n=1 Tax=Favolaschia claudopus TaxID=2862362 RepID=A0AAW0DSA0_9AGAR
MSDALIDSIPPLIPVPASSSSPKPSASAPSAAKTRVELDREAEEAFDRFATLFSPPTPRASPLDPLFLPPQTEAPHAAPDVSPESEFGSFVSVSATEDPLSLMSPPPPDLETPIQPEPRPGHLRTQSQNFFDEFSRFAKDRTETTQRGILDELLMHEDDPLYWIKDQAPTAVPQEEELLPSQKPNKYMTDSLSDLDLDFFSSPQTATSHHQRAASTPSHFRSPTRSPTTTARPTLAPPQASPSTSADAPGFDNSHPHQVHAPNPARSNSYASLASLSRASSAKWVASFLPAALSAPSASVPNTNMLPQSPTASRASPASSLSNSLTLPPQPQHQHPHPHAPVAGPSREPLPEFSHVNPFGAKDTGYVPPTGAPGFRGTATYDWDRGFSQSLERDLGVMPPSSTSSSSSMGANVSASPSSYFDEGEEMLLADATNGALPRRPSPGNGHGVGVLLEKKMSVAINLVGRREATEGVLTPELVARLHPHLPALLRLPRQWTLFYSVDQHGISLNTLYSRCAPPSSTRTPHPKGALLVIQDAGGVLFGAWVADGLRRSTRGGYYGGGESFLWRYIPASGQFDVYKWTGKNDYVALCEDGFISFGGGDGHYGLYLDESLFDGSSASCPTFENAPLCSGSGTQGGKGNVNFECVGLEVWGVGP